MLPEGRADLVADETVEDAAGLLGVDEMDHLLGKVFVEYLSPLKRNRIKTKLLKQQKQAERA